MGSLILLPALLIVMWFVLMRPQQKRMREHQQLLTSLEIGDEVLTNGGIYGAIAEFDGPTVFLLVADGVEIKVTRESIAQRVSYDEPDESDS
ncbi:MAG: preprotein translocase subunit YajC [Acidimicrobiales bacterium]|nr:preprotein translocase subunit YajC [Acidimicrobiales bacterium]